MEATFSAPGPSVIAISELSALTLGPLADSYGACSPTSSLAW